MGAQKGKEKIAVDVKSFTGASDIVELERALGQCIIYQDILSVTEPDRTLYLAVTDEVASEIFVEAIGKFLIQKIAFFY